MPELRPHQDTALDFMLDRQRSIYADPPGAGKTATTLRWLGFFGLPSLVVAPLSVLGHWEREAARWYPQLQVIRGDGSAKQRAASRSRLEEAERYQGDHPAPAALLLNYEAFRADVKDLIAMSWGAVVFDEAHRLKGRNTLTGKAAILIARRCERLALLTGTPIMNRADELWSLLRLIDPANYRSFWGWAHRYFETEVAHYIKSPRPVTIVKGVKAEMLPELREAVLPLLIQRPLEAILPDLPPVEHVMYPVRLAPAERRIYDALEKHSWVQSEDGTILQVSNAVSKIARQRQMASDFSSLFDGGAPASKAKAAIEIVRDLVEAGEQVVVVCAYRHTVESIAEALDHAEQYHGGVDTVDREVALARFQGGKADVIVGTQATIGEGVDGLQVARHLVMVDRDWTPARNEQTVGRLHRSGQRNSVTVHHVYCENTIDETVARTCEAKEQIIDSVLGGPA